MDLAARRAGGPTRTLTVAVYPFSHDNVLLLILDCFERRAECPNLSLDWRRVAVVFDVHDAVNVEAV